MALSLRVALAGPPSKPIGSTALFAVHPYNPPTPLLTFPDSVWLRSGFLSQDEEALYPEAYSLVKNSPLKNWLPVSYTGTGPSGPAYSFAYGNGTYILGGGPGTYATSKDGKTWTKSSPSYGPGPAAVDMLFTNNLFVMVCSAGIFTTPDGVLWTNRNSNTGLNQIKKLGNYIYAFGSQVVYRSLDGITWVQVLSASRNITGIYSLPDGSICVATGLQSSVSVTFKSPDGAAPYTQITASGPRPTTNLTYCFAQGNGVLVEVSGGTSYASKDGVSWKSATLPDGASARNVVYILGTFVMGTTIGTIYSSPDGLVWTPVVTSATGKSSLRIVYLETGVTLHSSDATSLEVKIGLSNTVGIGLAYTRPNYAKFMRIK